ncbi:MAG: ABC transporter ATP-binding protein [Thaumarchaeota archaeon]|nr:ABC transporter ATP-binding protein [Nitrososphaerota archaeon]
MESVSAGYGKLQIINDISLEANQNEVTVIVGPNGSGKSTLLKTISGLTTLYKGKISLDGKVLSGLPPHEIAKLGLAYLPQTESVFTQLTVAENFKMAGYTIKTEDVASRLQESLEIFPQLRAYLRTKVQNLSGGERQMVAMTMAMLRKPKIIMFDEPTANLAPKVATQVLKTVAGFAHDSKLGVVLVEQNARRALEIGDKAYLLVSGRKVFEGGTKELLEHKELSKLYLGLKVEQ